MRVCLNQSPQKPQIRIGPSYPIDFSPSDPTFSTYGITSQGFAAGPHWAPASAAIPSSYVFTPTDPPNSGSFAVARNNYAAHGGDVPNHGPYILHAEPSGPWALADFDVATTVMVPSGALGHVLTVDLWARSLGGVSQSVKIDLGGYNTNLALSLVDVNWHKYTLTVPNTHGWGGVAKPLTVSHRSGGIIPVEFAAVFCTAV